MKATNITTADFLNKVMDYKNNPKEWKYKGDKPAIIDFYASWCGPCRMLAPILDEIANEYDGKIFPVNPSVTSTSHAPSVTDGFTGNILQIGRAHV